MTKPLEWRCFHCHQVFTEFHAAEAHFGRRTTEPPECYPYLAMVREARECRWFTQQIMNGLDTGMLRIDTPAEDTVATIIDRGRAALAKPVSQV